MWNNIEPYNLIGKQVKDVWRKGEQPNTVFGRTLKQLFAQKPFVGIYLAEYPDANFEFPNCKGKPTGTWYYDGRSFVERDLPKRIEQESAIWTSTPIISFHFRSIERDLVINLYCGPRAASGNKYIIAEKHGYRYLELYGNGWQA